jgi:hypothetical protein
VAPYLVQVYAVGALSAGWDGEEVTLP